MQPLTRKIRVAVLGATGMVGQRFIMLLAQHPWFEISVLAASPSSAGKSYKEAVEGRWNQQGSIPESIQAMRLLAVESDCAAICEQADLAFSALDMDKSAICKIEERYAEAGLAVVSNNSAHRWTPDVPMLMPEVNPDHCDLISLQRKNRGWKTGFIAVKPNCSIQSYVPLLAALKDFKVEELVVTTLQAVSGAGKTLNQWPEMIDNVIPHISGEEEKSEKEPLKVLGRLQAGGVELIKDLKISATCIRVPVSDGHMASVNLKFANPVSKDEILKAFQEFSNPIAHLELPSCPKNFITYFSEENRPQTKDQRDLEKGMGISVGRLRQDGVLGWKCVALSHNTVRGAAGGAVLMAELLVAKGLVAH